MEPGDKTTSERTTQTLDKGDFILIYESIEHDGMAVMQSKRFLKAKHGSYVNLSEMN